MTGRPPAKPLPPAPAHTWLRLVRWASGRGAGQRPVEEPGSVDTREDPVNAAPLPVQLRRAEPADAAALSALMHTLSHHLLDQPSSAESLAFLEATSAERLTEVVAQGNCVCLVATHNAEIHGFIAIRDGQHVSHFFVAEPYQGQGIGKRLWVAVQRALRSTQTTVFTVDASPASVPFYERLGFRASSAPVQRGGLALIPMRGFARQPARSITNVHQPDDA